MIRFDCGAWVYCRCCFCVFKCFAIGVRCGLLLVVIAFNWLVVLVIYGPVTYYFAFGFCCLFLIWLFWINCCRLGWFVACCSLVLNTAVAWLIVLVWLVVYLYFDGLFVWRSSCVYCFAFLF